MICPSCGKENAEGSLFCNACGAKFLNEETNKIKIGNEQEKEVKLNENVVQDDKNNKKLSKKNKIILSIVILILIVGISLLSKYLYELHDAENKINDTKNKINVIINTAEECAKQNNYKDAVANLSAAYDMYDMDKENFGKLNDEVKSKLKEYTYESYATAINKVNHVQDFDNDNNDSNVSDSSPGAILYYYDNLKSKGYTDEINKLYSVIINKMKTTLNQDKVFGDGIRQTLITMAMNGIGDKDTLRQIYKLNQSYLTEEQKTTTNTMTLDGSIEVRDYIKNPDKYIPKKPSIGMTADEVRKSTWGSPSHINKTTTAYGTSEQWVYSNYKYIYLENGVVTTIQE